MDMFAEKEDFWSLVTMPEPPHELRLVELENEKLSSNNICHPTPFDGDCRLLPLSPSPSKDFELPPKMTVNKNVCQDSNNVCGEITEYELLKVHITEEEMTFYVGLKGSNSASDCCFSSSGPEEVIMSCPPLKSLSDKDMIFVPTHCVLDGDNEIRTLQTSERNYVKKDTPEVKICNIPKVPSKNDVGYEVEFVFNSFESGTRKSDKKLKNRSNGLNNILKPALVSKRKVLDEENALEVIEIDKSKEEDDAKNVKVPSNNDCGEITEYDLHKVNITEEEVIFYVQLKGSDSASDVCLSSSRPEEVIMSCPPLKSLSDKEMIFVPTHCVLDGDNEIRNLQKSEHDYVKKDTPDVKICNIPKSPSKNDVGYEVEFVSNSFESGTQKNDNKLKNRSNGLDNILKPALVSKHKVVDEENELEVIKIDNSKEENDATNFEVPSVPKRRVGILQQRNIHASSVYKTGKPFSLNPNIMKKQEIVEVKIIPDVPDAKIISEKDTKPEVAKPEEGQTIKTEASSVVPVLPPVSNVNKEILMDELEKINFLHLPIEDIFSETVGTEEVEIVSTTEDSPLLQTCLEEHVKVKIDAVAAQIPESEKQSSRSSQEMKYRCRNIGCNRTFLKQGCRKKHEKRCLSNSFLQ